MIAPQAAVLTIGNELLDGRVLDTNTQYLAEFLHSKGLQVRFKASCRDNLDEIQDTIRFLVARAPCLIISGGLGPTSDDLTREAVAQAAQDELYTIESELQRLKNYFESRGIRPFPQTNARQAMFPRRSKIIPNPVGTASGFCSAVNGALVYCLPGVPRELKAMCTEQLDSLLHQQFSGLKAPESHSFGVFGLAESRAGELIEAIHLSDDIEVSYRASSPYLQIKLSHRTPGGSLTQAVTATREALGHDFIFTEGQPIDMSFTVHKLLQEKKLRVSTAESCTGGLLARMLTEHAGSSEYFIGSVVAYSNQAKLDLLEVSLKTLEEFGAVSHEIAKELAEGARKKFKTDFAVSTTGIAGPGGGSEQKPVGTVFIGLSSSNETLSFQRSYPLQRAAMRNYTSVTALDLLRRKLLGLKLV